jgi:hypothetical protein
MVNQALYGPGDFKQAEKRPCPALPCPELVFGPGRQPFASRLDIRKFHLYIIV